MEYCRNKTIEWYKLFIKLLMKLIGLACYSIVLRILDQEPKNIDSIYVSVIN